MTKLLIFFILLNVANVIIQTVKSIATIKGGKLAAALTNAIAYGLYTVVVVYMTCDDLSLLARAMIVGGANLVGVYVVKLFEEKSRKDKLWKIEVTVREHSLKDMLTGLDSFHIPYNVIPTSDGIHTVVDVYAYTQEQSKAVAELIKKFNAKYFASETSIL